jgi:hypothetical protein
MAIDRPCSDDSGDAVDLTRERGDHRRIQADEPGGVIQLAETRSRREVYEATRVRCLAQFAADRSSSEAPEELARRSSWNEIDTSRRPPLDAIRVSPERARHILDGDNGGGGHRHGTGTPGKTEFPAHWDDETITNVITVVARTPDSVHQQDNGRWKARGEFDGVDVTVIIQPDGEIWTAWPDEASPGVVRNPEEGSAR